jgi:hypothetical protein
MPKQYSYQFSYYWKVTWPNNAVFKADSQNYRGFKQRVKREFKIVNDDSVVLYLNLRWTTTLGKIKSLFPGSTSIEVSSAEEFKEVKESRDTVKPQPKNVYKLKRVLEPSDNYSYCIQELPPNGEVKTTRNDRKRTLRTLEVESEGIQKFEPSDTFNGENLVKKVHTEEDSRSTESTDADGRSPKFMELHSPKVEPEFHCVSDLDAAYSENKIRNDEYISEPAPENEDDFKWETGFLPDLNIDEFSFKDFSSQKIKNYKIENSIDPIYWEYDSQDKFNFGVF